MSTSDAPEPSTNDPGPRHDGASGAAEAGRRATARRVAGTATAVEGLVLAGFFGFWIYEIVVGATEDLARAATSAVLILVFAVLLLVVARGWFAGADWARTPTLVWNVLLLPVAWSLHTSDRDPVALAVLAVAVVSVGAALAAPPPAPEDPETPVS